LGVKKVLHLQPLITRGFGGKFKSLLQKKDLKKAKILFGD
jgi:hypothetical protein